MAKETKNKLTPKQIKFVKEYLKDLNATQAAIRSGYSKKTARMIGCENLTKPNIQEEIEKQFQKIELKSDIASPTEVLTGYTKETRFDPRLLFDEDKNPLPIPDLPEDAALALTGFEINETVVKTTFEENSKEEVIKRVYKYKFPDKHKNRESLGKYHKIGGDDGSLISKTLIDLIIACLPDAARAKLAAKIESVYSVRE